jgi:SMP-30/Gluconolactonase/LRE-like region
MALPAVHLRRRSRQRLGLAIALAAAAALAGCSAAAPPPLPSGPPYVVIAGHLANPRGLFIEKGTSSLYFTEAGFGGGSPKAGVKDGTGQNGRLSVVDVAGDRPRTVRPLATNLWSDVRPESGFSLSFGPAGLTAHGGRVSVAMEAKTGGPHPQEGRLLEVSPSGVRAVADIATASVDWESTRADLNSQFPDTNPYDVTEYRADGVSTLYVIDAAANTVSRVGARGRLDVIAYLPDTATADAIPTCLAQGPDGALYVTTLAFLDGAKAAKVYRIDPKAHRPVLHAADVWASGLTALNGCAFSPDGTALYVSEFQTALDSSQAAVVRLPFAHPNSGRTSLGRSFLQAAGGVAVDRDGRVYVANRTNQDPGKPSGQVLRLRG